MADAHDHRPARWPPFVLVAVFVVGFALASVVVVVRDRVLDPSLYSEALVRTDAYERVYTEVLADPELAELKEQLLGGLQLDRLDATQLRVLTTSALRATVPPSSLRDGTETFVASVLAYLRGETARLDADVDVTELLGRIRETAVVAVSTLLAPVADRVVISVDEYRDAVAAFAAQLRSGTVPGAIPVLGGRTVDPLLLVDVVIDELDVGVDRRQRDQILAAVLAGDERGALIDAASRVITEHAAKASEDLRASIEDHGHYDVITGLAERAGRSRAMIVGQLNSARDAARWFSPVTALLGLVLMLGAAAGIVWLERANPRRAGFTLAAAAAASGLTLLVLWMVATGLLEAPLAPATGSGPGSWNLPAGLRSLLADIQTTLGDELALTVRRLSLVPIAAGAVFAAVLVAVPRLRLPSPARALPIGAAAAVIAGVAVAIVSRDAAALERCNGYAELCDRPYDEVVYAATHNSMSSPDVVVVWPEHDGDIGAQLDYGVRALLIDTHYWSPLVSDEQLTAADPYLPPALAAQIFDSLGPLRGGRDGTYLCHNVCALGATPLVDSLRTIREFLDENPAEVITLIIQDAITPADTADAVALAGLEPYLHTHRPGTPWATLGELVDRNERLVVFAEAQGSPTGWYHAAFEYMQETPYRFEEPDDFSCAANRGDPDATLFLMNHWVQRIAPDRADAVTVNRHDLIVDRARACQRERGQEPNFVAVNFYSIGDLIGAVTTLNGLE